MKRGGPLRRRTPLRQVSRKRRDEKSARDAVRAEVTARDGAGCHALRVLDNRRAAAAQHHWPLTCWHPSGLDLDLHERIPRSAWPGGQLVASNVMLVCRRHHEWIDAHETTAATLGLHGYSWDRPKADDG